MFYYNVLRLQFESSFHLCQSIHFCTFSPHCYFQSSCHSEFVFLPAQWRIFTITVVDCYFIFFSSFPMSVTTCLYRCLHTNYFAERSYCCHIPPLGILILGLSSVVSMTPSMATDLIAAPHLYPLFLLLADHPSKIGQDL